MPGVINAVGYLPHARQALADSRYSRQRFTEGDDFSPGDPLAFHEDWVVDQGVPSDLRLIGIGGDDIAACEYKIAIALGVRVGLIVGSGGAADGLLGDTLWTGVPNLTSLTDRASVESFLRS
jgi:hypothetical protein